MASIQFMTAVPLVRTALICVVGCALSGAVSAQSMRCKQDFAEIGNSKGTILQKCGEPVLKDSFCRSDSEDSQTSSSTLVIPGSAVTNFIVNQCIKVDEWTYNPGYGQFMTMLQFEGGELKRMRYGDRVTR